jgi:uncharacterized protein
LAHKLKYRVLPQALAVCRVAAGKEIPPWALSGEFSCIVRTPGETSIVCAEDLLPPEREGVVVESGWIALELEGPFPFAMTGVLASFVEPLAEAGIPVFALSTFDTDYVLLKNESLKQALTALGAAGHQMVSQQT